MGKIATGINKRLQFAPEAVFGVKDVTATAKKLRRVSSTLALSKDSYESKEIREDYQIDDMRHGVRKVEGEIKGEISPGSYNDFIEAALRSDFALLADKVDAVFAMAADGVARTAGSFLADGYRAGDVVSFAGFASAANNNCNFLVTKAEAAKLTGRFIIDRATVAEPAGAMVTIKSTQKAIVPAAGHTDKSFSIEHFHADIEESELYLGCKVNSVDISLPPTGMTEISVKLMGQDMITAGAEQLPGAAPASTTGVLAAVNGLVIALGKRQTVLTGLTLSINGNISGDPVVGSNVQPELFAGRVKIAGQMTAYFDNVEFRDAFLNESEVSLIAVFTSSNAPDANFVSFVLPRIKLGGSSKDDGEKGLVQTIPFSALLGHGENGFDRTTIAISDKSA